MKWGYFKNFGNEIEYLDVATKVELFVPCKPDRVLMLFKNPTANDFVVCDYLTGIKIHSDGSKKAAKALLTVEMSRKAQIAINLRAKQGFSYPEVNTL